MLQRRRLLPPGHAPTLTGDALPLLVSRDQRLQTASTRTTKATAEKRETQTETERGERRGN
jgi:hypothetical protein